MSRNRNLLVVVAGLIAALALFLSPSTAGAQYGPGGSGGAGVEGSGAESGQGGSSAGGGSGSTSGGGTAGEGLPRTGSDRTGELVAVGVAVLAVGGLIVYGVGRRTAT